MTEQELNQIKADAIMNFVDVHLGAFESGFVDSSELSLYSLHKSAQSHIVDNYSVSSQSISDKYGREFSEMCKSSKERAIQLEGAFDKYSRKYKELISCGASPTGEDAILLAGQYFRAIEVCSVSRLQRCFRIGYVKAATIIEDLEKRGIVNTPNNSGVRTVNY